MKPRLKYTFSEQQGLLSIEWAINDNLTSGFIKRSAQRDVLDILEVVRNGNLQYQELHLSGTFPLIDQYGNETEKTVVELWYKRDTINRINFDNMLTDNAYVIADDVWVHPVFRD